MRAVPGGGDQPLFGGVTAFAAFVGSRMIYSGLGAAAPQAVQAIVAGETGPAERTKALTLLAFAFGLCTILGPAIAPCPSTADRCSPKAEITR